MVNLVVDCLKSQTSLDQVKGVWQALESTDDQCTPFSTWLWADTWWRECGSEVGRLRIIVVKNGQEVVGLCPLYRETVQHLRVLPVTTLALLGGFSDMQTTHPGVIAQPRFRKQVEAAVMDYLPKLKGWDTLELDGMDINSSFVALARKHLKTRGGVAVSEAVNGIPEESLLRTWIEYRAAGDGQRATQVKRLSKKMTELGECAWSLCSTRSSLNEMQEVFYELELLKATKGKKRKYTAASRERFFRAIVPEFFITDMLWQLSLRIDGKVVGVQYYFIWRGDLLLFQGAYNADTDQKDVANFMLGYAITRGMGQAMRRVRIHTQASDTASTLVSDVGEIVQLRFTPSKVRRVVDKTFKSLNKG